MRWPGTHCNVDMGKKMTREGGGLLAAVTQDGYTLEDPSALLQDDREVALAALALTYFSRIVFFQRLYRPTGDV